MSRRKKEVSRIESYRQALADDAPAATSRAGSTAAAGPPGTPHPHGVPGPQGSGRVLQPQAAPPEATAAPVPAPVPDPASPDPSTPPRRLVRPSGTSPRPPVGAAAAPEVDSVQDRRAARAVRSARRATVGGLIRSRTAFLVLVVAFCLAASATIGFGFPCLGHSWDWVAVAVGVAVVGLIATLLWRARGQVGRRGRLAGITSVLLVLVIFSLGAAHSVVLHGKVYPSTSKTARAYVLAQQLQTDLYAVAHVDKLLTYDVTDARAHYSEYAPAITAMQTMTDKWGSATLSGLPDPQLIGAITSTKVASNYMADALGAKQRLLTVSDPALQSQVTSDRETVASEVLAAAHQLVGVSADFGFTLFGQVHE